MYIVLDWENNVCFDNKEFQSEVEAEEYLKEVIEMIGLEYEKERKEYEIIRKIIM